MSYSVSAVTALGYDDAVAAAREALAAEGFGVLTEIDVKATMKAKLGLDRDPYIILGACNPGFAHRALEAEPELGVLLPCNVVVRVEDGRTLVSAVSAGEMLGMVGNPALEPIAAEVGERLERVIAALGGA
ncbi:MAG: DUF302 domain-containing protein [Thermoleophilia bacterium]|nr:DUF302 domain-containing protein [Thermoleophilia bacterium]